MLNEPGGKQVEGGHREARSKHRSTAGIHGAVAGEERAKSLFHPPGGAGNEFVPGGHRSNSK